MTMTTPTRCWLIATVCSILLAGSASAGPIPTLELGSGGSIVASPDDLIGWNLRLTADSTYWISVTTSSVVFESNPLGVYTDYIGLMGGSTGGATPADQYWDLVFDPTAGWGYRIASSALPGSVNHAFLQVSYDLYSGDPSSGGSYVDSGDLSAAVEISIADSVAVPEPTLWGSTGMALLILAWARRKLGSR